jgi:hypothetical protein
MRDTPVNTPLYHKLFLKCLQNTLMPGSSVVSVAMPGDAFTSDLRQGMGRLEVFEALSVDFLAAYPGYAGSLMASRAGQRLLAQQDGHVQVADPRRVGQGFIPTGMQQRPAQSLSRFLRGLQNPGLLYLDSDADAGELFLSAFDGVVDRGTLVWMELRVSRWAETLAQLRSHPLWEQVDAFGLDRQHGCLDLKQSEACELYGLLLVPRSHWQGHGLHRLAAQDSQQQVHLLRAPLAVPVSRQASEALIDILSGTGIEPYAPIAPERIFLPAGSHLFGRNVRVGPVKDGHRELGLDSMGQRRIQLMFQPPMPGVFELRLTLAREPEHDIQMTIGALRLPLRWVDDWSQLQSRVHLTADHAARPLIFELSCIGSTRPKSLMIKGVEVEYAAHSGAGTLSSVCKA